MSDGSQIQWTDATWNPTTGCTKVSPGCAHCYIERTPAFRIAGRRFEHGATDLVLHDNRIEQPLHWTKPRRVFVNSLSDLFHEGVPDAFIDRVFAVMALAPQHTFQMLTKRAERMRAYMASRSKSAGFWKDAARTVGYALEFQGISLVPFPLPNVWLGVSVENQHFADERIPLLLQTPAAVRFISAEPLLESVDLRFNFRADPSNMMSAKVLELLHWVIDGGESGQGARDYRLEWSLSLQRQCAAAGVAYFRKQVGARPIAAELTHWRCPTTLLPDASGYRLHLRDKKGGDPAEWPADLRVREFPRVTA